MLEKFCYVTLSVTAIVMAAVAVQGRGEPTSVRPETTPAVSVGERLPYLAIRTEFADSAPVTEGGKTSFIVFFSPSCPYCVASVPVYKEIAETRCDMELSIVANDVSSAEISEWWSERAWPLMRDGPVCADVKVGAPVSPTGLFGIKATPTHFLVDENGRVLHVDTGVLVGVPDWLPAR